MNKHNNVIKMIGNTPLVKINKLNPNPNVEIWAKFEGNNPGGSIKDRVALNMIESAENSGELVEGKTIIEATSGNTGIGLALVGLMKGYEVEIVMSEAVSIERRKMIQAFGAKVTLTDPSKGTDGAIKKVRDLVEKFPEKYYNTDQFSSHSNYLAHYKSTAEEIWFQTEGRIDYFVSALGTSGTIMGVGKYLKEKDPSIKIVSAHPVFGHYIQGLKNMEEAIVPAIYDVSKIDETIMVESEDAFEVARQIVKQEGLFVGMSSGAAMYSAIEIAKKIKEETPNEKKTIVTIFPDRGEKYLSTKLFDV